MFGSGSGSDRSRTIGGGRRWPTRSLGRGGVARRVQRASISAVSSSGPPSLRTTRFARPRLVSRGSWAGSRAAKDSAVHPRWEATRASRTSSGASTNATRSQRVPQPASYRTAASRTTAGTPPCAGRGRWRARRSCASGGGGSLPGPLGPRGGRRRSPPARRGRSGRRGRGSRRRSGRRPGRGPGSAGAGRGRRRRRPATKAPRAASSAATKLLPAPMPPTSPSTGIVPCFQGPWGRGHRGVGGRNGPWSSRASPRACPSIGSDRSSRGTRGRKG